MKDFGCGSESIGDDGKSREEMNMDGSYVNLDWWYILLIVVAWLAILAAAGYKR